VLGHLVKLAARSAQLREAAIQKEAGILGAIGGAIARNPGKSLAIGATAYAGGGEAIKKSKEFKAGFNPQSPQQQLAGAAPVPPGA
jgi:hypothetical protein